MSWRRRLQLAAVIAFVIAYAGLSHYSNSVAKTHDLGVGLALRPRARGRHCADLALDPSAGCAVGGAVAAVLLRHYWPVLERNFPLVYLLQEAGFYSLMAASFGLSLRRPSSPVHAAGGQGARPLERTGGAVYAPASPRPGRCSSLPSRGDDRFVRLARRCGSGRCSPISSSCR